MDYNEIAQFYRHDSAHGSHPVELVGKLYERLLEDFRRALNAANESDIPARTASLNHALQIVAELQSVLDHERGGEVSKRLNGLYEVTRPLILQANLHSDTRYLQKLLDLYTPLREAWRQVEREAKSGGLENPGDRSSQAELAAAAPRGHSGVEDADSPRVQWSA